MDAQTAVNTGVDEHPMTESEIELSKAATTNANAEILLVNPEDVKSDPDILGLRDRGEQTDQRQTIPELARTMLEEQQISPCTVRATEEGWVMVDGERRRQAVLYLRANGYPEWPLKVTELRDIEGKPINQDTAWRMAALAGIQNERFTDLELGKMFREARARFGFGKNSSQVAAFFGVSPATITQKERLLEVVKDEPEVRSLIDGSDPNARMTGTAALETLSAPKEERGKVAKKAREIAEKEAADKPKPKKFKEAKVKADGSVELVAPIAESVTVPVVKVETTHVRKAMKALGTHAKTGKRPAPKMGEAIALIEGLWVQKDAPRVLAEFGVAFAAWGHGKRLDKEVEKAAENVVKALTPIARKARLSALQPVKVVVDGKAVTDKAKKAAKTKKVVKAAKAKSAKSAKSKK